jgi:hypothetical protein
MNNFTKFLVNDLLEQKDQKITAIYGGGFKPPTKGHFDVIKQATEQNPEIDDFIIYIGGGTRDNITQGESIQIWDIYKKYLPLKVRIEPVKSPVGDILRYAKEHPEETVLWVIGARENNPEDWSDISARTRTLDKYPNIQLRVIQTQGGVSGTAARKAVEDNDKEQFFKLIPDIEEKEQVWDIVSGMVNEGLSEKHPKAIKFWALYYNIFQALKPNPEERYNVLSQKLKGEQKEALDYFYNEFFKDGKSLDEASEEKIQRLKNLKEVVTATESFYLNIPKFNQPKTVQQYLIESLNEISLSKENAAKINGDLTGGTFTVGDITYEYSIKNIPNPYKDLGLFYNIQFTPSGEVTSIPKGGKENYIKILSTMYKIILDFIEKEQPTYVGISSLDNSGDKNYHIVYNRLTSSHMNFIPGYFRKDSNLTFNSPQGKGRFIVLKKKDSLDEKKSKDLFGLNTYIHELVKDNQLGTALPYGSGFSPLKEAWNLQDAFVTLSQYMIDNGMNIQPLPKIKVIKDDEKNASDLLGKTAYYNPSEKSITLYTMDRHPKDILRSFAHEMVHHEQNLEGRINNINTTNTNEDGDLPEIEKEAYEKGNMMLRNWEDSIKNS